MALHRTKGEMIARYTEGWPLDLVPGRTRDLSRPANFDKAFSKRAPYEAGDGIEDWMLVAWGNGGSGRSKLRPGISSSSASSSSSSAGVGEGGGEGGGAPSGMVSSAGAVA